MTDTITDLQQMRQFLQQEEKNLYGCLSGYPELDALTGGLIRGGVTLVCGRPAMGKTALLLNLVSRISKMQAGSIVFVSPEERQSELTMRYMSIATGLPPEKMLDGSVPPQELEDRFSRMFFSQESKVKLLPYTSPSLADIRRTCDHTEDLRLLVVDDIESICQPVNLAADELSACPLRESAEEVFRYLRALAVERDVPVVCAARLHRALESRKNKRPKLTDIRRIGVTEEMVDQILFLYRDNYYDYESDASAELIVGKSLMGQTGTVTLEWAFTTGCFRELQK